MKNKRDLEKAREAEKGQAIVLLILFLVGLLAVTALAVDGGRLYQERRHAQNGADNAALAGALAICGGENVTSQALAAAAQNGFDNDGSTNTVAVNQPPASGPSAGDSDYVEVLITSKQTTAFAKFIYSGAFQTTARAVGHCDPQDQPPFSGYGLIALNPDENCSFRMNSNNSVLNVSGGGIQVDSSDNDALCIGNAAISTTGEISVVGDYDIGPNGDVDPTPSPGSPYLPDPLAFLDPPDRPSGSCTSYSLNSHSIGTIDPGLYCSINVSAQAGLTMNPGVYYIEGGDFSFTGQGNLTAQGVTIYMNEGNFSISGGGSLEMTTPTSGQWEGMLLFFDQANAGSIDITGQGTLTIAGTIYASAADITLSGNGSGNTLYSQIIGDTIGIGGNGQLDVSYDPDQAYNPGPANDTIDLAE